MRIIVVGAGPVGLTLAWLLVREGISVQTLEASDQISDQLRASTFHPPSLDMLRLDGIADVLHHHGRITPTWQIRHHETNAHVTFDLGVLAGHTDHPYRLQCHQKVLSQALADRLTAAGSPPRFRCPILSAGQGKHGAWVQPATGPRLEADYVIGADGARSIVRTAIGSGFEGAAYPETTILATTRFPFEQVLPDLAGVNYVWKAGGTFSLLRLPDLWRCSFQARGDSDAGSQDDQADLHRHLQEVFPKDADRIEIIEQRAYRVHRRLADRWRDRRLFIAGDAAHLNSPKGGMGLNGGIHDAFELVASLTKSNGDPTADVLDRYERRRKPVVATDIIAQADANQQRMAITDSNSRQQELERLQRLRDDKSAAIEFLRGSSMLTGLAKASETA